MQGVQTTEKDTPVSIIKCTYIIESTVIDNTCFQIVTSGLLGRKWSHKMKIRAELEILTERDIG